MGNSILLVTVFVFFVFVAGLFAGSETGMYHLSRVRMRLGIEKRRFSYVTLGKIMHDGPGLLLSTLLGTNLSQYLATTAMTYVFLVQVGAESAEVLATLVAAPVFFVFTDLIPKNLFFYRADFLMPRMAPVLFVFHRAFTWCGAVPVLRSISGAFSRLAGLKSSSKSVITSAQRHRIRAILQDTREEGFLSSVQTEMLDRVVSIPGIRISSVMIRKNRVRTVDFKSDRVSLMKKLEECAFTRFLVYRRHKSNIVGYVNIYEALSSPKPFRNLKGLVKPIKKLDGDTAVSEAIHVMQSGGHKIVLVTRFGRSRRERAVGIVTMKDLAEELLGELAEW